MSHTIFYQVQSVVIPASSLGTPGDVFVLCTLSGANNCYTWNDQRVRKWATPFIGLYDDVFAHQLTWLRHGIYWQSDNSKLGELADHQWLGKIRSALDKAQRVPDSLLDSNWLQTGRLEFLTHNRCKDMTIREAIHNSIHLRAQSAAPSYSDWDVFRVTGPGEV